MKRLLLSLLLSGVCFAQTAVVLAPVPKLQFFDSSGRPLAFGCVFTYASTTVTPLATYTDYTGTTQNANPVVLSAGGFASIWLQAGLNYTLKVKSAGATNCSSGTQLYSVDGIGGGSAQATTIVPYSPTPLFIDSSQNQLFEITLTGNAVSQPLQVAGVNPPGLITWQITQDGIGGHTFTWPVNVLGGAAIGLMPNQVTMQHFVWNGLTATAVGPATTGAGPAISTGTITVAGDALISGLETVGTTLTVGSNLTVGGTGVFGSTVTSTGLISATANPASAGFLRLAKTDPACWRNVGNTADLCINGSAVSNFLNYLDLATVLVGSQGSLANISTNQTSGIEIVLPQHDPGGLISLNAGDAATAGNNGGSIHLVPGQGSGAASGSVLIAHGMGGDGLTPGLQHTRTASCATAAAAGATCSTAITYIHSFDDANYTAVCTVDAPTNQPYVLSTNTKVAGGFNVVIAALTAAAASGTLDCIAMHD